MNNLLDFSRFVRAFRPIEDELEELKQKMVNTVVSIEGKCKVGNVIYTNRWGKPRPEVVRSPIKW